MPLHAMTLYQNKYRSESTRRPGWDYPTPGWYFLTICTAHRYPFFCTIRNGIMGLSDAGCVAHWCWTAIPDHFDHVRLDAFVIMPNHVHGLVGIVEFPSGGNAPVDALESNASTGNRRMSQISPKPGSISTIMRSYKTAVTKRIRRRICADFAWQSRFHDSIIRTEREFINVRRYIRNNPANWTS